MAFPVPAAVIAALAAAAVGVAVVASRRSEVAAPAPAAPGSPPPAAEAVEAAPAPLAAGEAGSAPGAQPAAPRLDVVRVTPEGRAVVAGRAAPGATVTIGTATGEAGTGAAGTGTVAEVEADAAGDFVAVFEVEPAAGPRSLTVESVTAEGAVVASPDVVVLLPEPQAAAAAPEAAAASAGAAAGGGADAAGAAGRAANPAAGGGGAAAAPRIAAAAVLREDGLEAAPVAGAGPEELTLAGISYREAGAVTLAGLGPAGAGLAVYVDGGFSRAGEVAADGRWRLDLNPPAGVHRLRIDALGEGGRVLARVETPFQRDIPAPAPDGAAGPATVTVQPGGNLWTIARSHYGAGVLYTRIFAANRALIRDPELIYPGQIFVLPEGGPVE